MAEARNFTATFGKKGVSVPDNTDNIVTRNENKKKRGRPRKYADDAALSKAWKTKNNECRRLDCFISPSASWRIRKLSKE